MIKAKKLSKGDTIGVISPASRSESISEIIRAKEYWTEAGYNVVLSKNLNKKNGFTAGTIDERSSDINEMFKRDDIDAIFVTQGGYGSAQLIDKIDFDLIHDNPKIFTGFSDITSLHLAIQKFAGLVTFHSPGFSRFNSQDISDYTKNYFLKAITDPGPMGEIKDSDEKNWIHKIHGGKASGKITGGNLGLICSTLGTPYEIEINDKILFFEEVDAEPWIIDNSLSHLKNAGKLNQAAGIIVGECHNCIPKAHDPGFYVDTSLEEVLQFYLEPLGIPVLYGLPLGHGAELATLPIGVEAELDADNKKLIVTEGAVES